MALTEDDVHGIAEYATIALDETELAEMTACLNDAVDMLEPVLQYAAEGVELTFHPIGGLSNVMCADEPDADRALTTDVALANVGSVRDGQFRVHSTLGGGG